MIDLEAIKARAEAATGDRWEYRDGDILRHYDAGGADTLLCYLKVPSPDTAARFRDDADADFIAHAREDVPALVAEVERLRAILAPLLHDPYRLADPVVCCFCGRQYGKGHRDDCPVLSKDELLGSSPNLPVASDLPAAVE